MQIEIKGKGLTCKHVHVTGKTRTDGTPFRKAYCQECKAWAFSEKNFCICCRKRVSHSIHHFKLKTILNIGLVQHRETIEEYIFFPYRHLTYVNIEYSGRNYHVPLKYIALYKEHPNTNDVMSLIQDSIKLIR